MATRSEQVRQKRSSQPRRRRRNRGGALWNCMSVVILLGAAAVIAWVAMIYLNPASLLNPFPFPTLAPTLFLPTVTASPTPVPPTLAPTLTSVPSLTSTPLPPTLTPTPTLEPTETPTIGPSPTATIYSAYPYIMDTSSAISGETFHAGEGCKLWVGGQTVDLRRAPMVGIKVKLGGYLNQTVSQLSLT